MIKPYYEEPNITIYNGDCLDILQQIDDNSIDAIVTDPPYELGFMGKQWDASGIAYNVEVWKQALRVLKPGGYLLSFGGTRTYHRMVCAIEDAGFEIRDMVEWIYGSGFPKSLNIGKAIDKLNDRFYDKGFQDYCNELRLKKGYSHDDINQLMGTATTGGGFSSSIMGDKRFNELPTAKMYKKLKPILGIDNRYDELIERTEREREVIGKQYNIANKNNDNTGRYNWNTENQKRKDNIDITKGTSEWEGYGTALKPAHEPICMARKPLTEKSVAENCLKWGTGGINIDECRVVISKQDDNWRKNSTIRNNTKNTECYGKFNDIKTQNLKETGRFPANLIHDGSDEVLGVFPDTGKSTGGRIGCKDTGTTSVFNSENSGLVGKYQKGDPGFGDSGSAARFFYCAKASKAERNMGCEGLEKKQTTGGGGGIGDYLKDVNSASGKYGSEKAMANNHHPTVKPIKLMEYLIKLVSGEGQIILDPFMGSGSTLIAARNLKRKSMGIDKEEEYCKIAVKRASVQRSAQEVLNFNT